MKRFITIAALLTIGFTSTAAYADAKNPLDGQPAVRKRTLYLPKRFEIAPQIGLTYLQDFKNSFLIGVKMEYHFIEYLSVGVFFDYAAVNWDTGLTNEIEDTLPDRLNRLTTVDPSPSKSIMYKALDTLLFKAGVYLAYTPWFGKLSLFGKLFGKFDLHVLAGAGFAYLKAGNLSPVNSSCAGDIDPNGTCEYALYLNRKVENGGFKVGPLVGFGLRFFLLRWLALQFNFNTIIVKRNSAGFDKNGDTDPSNPNVVVIDKKDESWENIMSFTIGVSFFLPTKAPTSR
jgi:outer membrane beta-barrel protein